jgi:hypothetical protein
MLLNAEQQLILATTCNPLGVRIFQIILGLGLAWGGSFALRRALKGKIKRFMAFRVILEGSDASLAAGCFATYILLLGLFVLFAAIFRLDC